MSNNYTVYTANTNRFQVTAEKDGVAWNLTGGTVTVLFWKPDGTALAAKSATISTTTAYYDTLVTDITTPGRWLVSFRVVLSGIDIMSPPQAFTAETPP